MKFYRSYYKKSVLMLNFGPPVGMSGAINN